MGSCPVFSPVSFFFFFLSLAPEAPTHPYYIRPPSKISTAATAAWCLPFGAYFFLLSGRVVYIRLTTGTALGDHIGASSPSPGKAEMGGAGANKTELAGTRKKTLADKPDPLYLAVRCYGNFIETVPMAVSVT